MAVQFLRLYKAYSGSGIGGRKEIFLAAFSGSEIGSFNYTIDAVISTCRTLFEVADLDRIDVKTGVFQQARMEKRWPVRHFFEHRSYCF